MEKLNFIRYFFGSKMIEIDFLIFEYLPLGEILRIFDFYFKNGTYNNGLPPGGRSRASFKNIHHYMQ